MEQYFLNHHKKPKVILDTDMGFMNDDALALSLLLAAQKKGLIEMIGITLAGGNTFVNAEYFNYGAPIYGSSHYTEELLEGLGEKNLPFFKGLDYPIGTSAADLKDLARSYEVTKENGEEKERVYMEFDDHFGCIHFFDQVDPALLSHSEDAVDFMIKSVRENPGEVLLIAIAPTMNIARAIEKDPDFAKNTAGIIYMAGGFGDIYKTRDFHGHTIDAYLGANTTAYSEYNVIYDAEAFYRCIRADFPVQLISPGELYISGSEEAAKRLKATAVPGQSTIADFWIRHYDETDRFFNYWDPYVAMLLVAPELITKTVSGYVTVNHNRDTAAYGLTRIISKEEYEKLPAEQQADYGYATVIKETKDFWSYAIEALTC